MNEKGKNSNFYMIIYNEDNFVMISILNDEKCLHDLLYTCITYFYINKIHNK